MRSRTASPPDPLGELLMPLTSGERITISSLGNCAKRQGLPRRELQRPRRPGSSPSTERMGLRNNSGYLAEADPPGARRRQLSATLVKFSGACLDLVPDLLRSAGAART